MQNNKNVFPKLNFTNILFFIIIIIGIFISTYNFFSFKDLWIDEAMLGYNIVARDFTGLTNPLDMMQIAPVGFLFIEKLLTIIFGENEFALRIFPFLSYLVSIPFVYLISLRFTKNKSISLLATSLFSINVSVLFYSYTLKQYEVEVLIALLIMYQFMIFDFKKLKHIIYFTLFTTVSMFISNGSLIIIFVFGGYILIKEIFQNRNYKVLIMPLTWLPIFIYMYFAFFHDHPANDYMQYVWAESFFPLNPFSIEFYEFIISRIEDVFGPLIGFGPYWIAPFIVSLFGIWYFISNKKYLQLIFIISPIFVHLILSGFKLYPFSGRIILYLIPFFLILLSSGFYLLSNYIEKRIAVSKRIPLVLAAIILFYPLLLGYHIHDEQTKDAIKYIEEKIEEDEQVYVYYGAYPAFIFYKETGYFNINNEVLEGEIHRFDHTGYYKQLEELSGNVWLLFSHVLLKDKDPEKSEEKYIIDYLLGQGAEIKVKNEYNGSTLYKLEIEAE